MAPKSEEQFGQIREKRKQDIMDVAMELFALDSYHAVSISMIARKAKISKGLIYNYFESKEHLLKTILEKGIIEVYEDFDANHDGILSKEEFHNFIRMNFKTLKENKHFWKLYYALSFQADVQEILHEISHTIIDSYPPMLIAYFKEEGSLDPMTDLLYFTSTLKGIFLQFVFTETDFPIEQLENKLLEFYK